MWVIKQRRRAAKALFLNDRVSMGLSYMSERRKHTEKTPSYLRSTILPSFLALLKMYTHPLPEVLDIWDSH